MNYNHFDNEYLSMRIENSIVYAKYKVHAIDITLAQEATRSRIEFTHNQSLPVLTDISEVKRVSKEARQYFSSEDSAVNVTALAVLVEHPVTRAIFNFFLKFQQPKYPVKAFSSTKSAEKWLKQYAA